MHFIGHQTEDGNIRDRWRQTAFSIQSSDDFIRFFFVLHSEITSINQLQFASAQVNFSLSIKTSEFVLVYPEGPPGTRQNSLN